MNRHDWIDMVVDQPISAPAKHVAHVMYRRMNSAGHCFPGVDYLSEKTSLNRKTVMPAIRALESAGLLTVIRQIGCKNEYRMAFPTSTEIGTGAEFGTSTNNGTSPKSGTSPESGTGPVPNQVLDQSQIRDSNQPSNQPFNQPHTAGASLALVESVVSDPPPAGFATWFDAWWEAYPKKTGRKPAEKKWKSRKLERHGRQLVEDVVCRAASCRKWQEGFIPNPLTYINQDRWNDEFERPKAGEQNGKKFDIDGWAKSRLADVAAARQSRSGN